MVKTIIFMTALLLAAAVTAQNTTPAKLEVEAKLCTGVVDHMPVGENTVFSKDVEKVYLWTKVTGVTEGEAVIHHIWLREDVEMADVSLPIKGSPWRTHSYKTIPPEWAGKWEVKITGADGNVIKSVAFTVGDAAPAPAQKKTSPGGQ